MYVCICRSVTDKEIRHAAGRGLRSIDQLRDELGVASGCGCCASLAEAVLSEAADDTPAPINAGWFSQPSGATA